MGGFTNKRFGNLLLKVLKYFVTSREAWIDQTAQENYTNTTTLKINFFLLDN